MRGCLVPKQKPKAVSRLPAVRSGEVLGWVDESDKRYSEDITNACRAASQRTGGQNLERLLTATGRWPVLAKDAIEAVEAAIVRARSQGSDAVWFEFLEGIRKERKGQYSGDDWAGLYGAILMPEKMLHTSLLAGNFHVPFGTAYIRSELVRSEKLGR